MDLRKQKAKEWTEKVICENMKTVTPADCQKYIHKTDRIALDALKKIPLFDKACSKALSMMIEPQRHIIDMSSKIQITENQIPRIFTMVKSICAKIGIEMPDLYLELNREPNAYTYGTEKFAITIHSGLLECLEDDELYAVLAHECGHIACRHVLYHTIGMLILEGGTAGINKLEDLFKTTVIGSIITSSVETSLELAFYYWNRCSELSADRAAIICCGSDKPVIETMMRLAGGTTYVDSEINRELFIRQAEEYLELTENNKINKTLEYLLTHKNTHPLLAVRAYEAQKFVESDEFKQLMN